MDYTTHSLDSLLAVYSSTMQSSLDKVAPILKKRITTQTIKPWIDDEVKCEKKNLERKMLKNRNSDSVANYKNLSISLN